MKPDAKAIAARAFIYVEPNVTRGISVEEARALCSRVEALEAALRDVLAISDALGTSLMRSISQRARAALEGT